MNPVRKSGDLAAAAAPLPRYLAPSLALEIGILLTLSVLFPFMIHLVPVPEDARLGPRLLPMFYAPLLGALLGRHRSAIIVALFAPWLNWALTSHPTPRGAWLMMLQLAVFVAVIRALLPRVSWRWCLVLPAYLACMLASVALATLVPDLIGDRPAVPWALQTIKTALPGIAILLGMNWLAVRNYPTGGDGAGPVSA